MNASFNSKRLQDLDVTRLQSLLLWVSRECQSGAEGPWRLKAGHGKTFPICVALLSALSLYTLAAHGRVLRQLFNERRIRSSPRVNDGMEWRVELRLFGNLSLAVFFTTAFVTPTFLYVLFFENFAFGQILVSVLE